MVVDFNLPYVDGIYSVSLLGFYGISTIVGYIIPNTFLITFLDKPELIFCTVKWFGFMAYQTLLAI